MGRKTSIPWADSTSNAQMGCTGCELSSRHGSGTCYAEVLTLRAGLSHKGYPADFYLPSLFLHRYEQMLKWPEISSAEREDKPWLEGLPRIVFHADMGDAFSPGMELDWFHPFVERFADMRALHLWLTKWPSRMRRSFEMLGGVPQNFLLGTSVTGTKSLRRVDELLRIPKARRWVSLEPDVEGADCAECWRELGDGTPAFEWVVLGGESGPDAHPYQMEWGRRAVDRLQRLGVRVFLKQIGSNPFDGGLPFPISDPKGEDWSEWPVELRVRQMPAWRETTMIQGTLFR